MFNHPHGSSFGRLFLDTPMMCGISEPVNKCLWLQKMGEIQCICGFGFSWSQPSLYWAMVLGGALEMRIKKALKRSATLS